MYTKFCDFMNLVNVNVKRILTSYDVTMMMSQLNNDDVIS